MNFNELRSKLDAIAEELEEIQVVEAEAELEEETVSEDEPSALDIAKMDAQTRMQYNAALRRKNAGPDKRTRDEKAADMSAAQAKIAQQKSSFDKPETDTYGDRLNKQLKMLKQRDAYNKAVSDMGGKPRKSKFSFEDEQFEETQAVEEATVEVPVQELADIMKLAGYANYSDKIEEYANEPEEEYSDVEDQMIGLSGGLNGPKKAYAAALVSYFREILHMSKWSKLNRSDPRYDYVGHVRIDCGLWSRSWITIPPIFDCTTPNIAFLLLGKVTGHF